MNRGDTQAGAAEHPTVAVPGTGEDSSGSPSDEFELTDGARVAVVGGGPAGSFVSYFLLQTAERVGLILTVDIYEPRDFSCTGPAGCNMCGGIVSESLVQLLAVEGIILPSTVVQRGINTYVLHTDNGSVQISPQGDEMRIAAVHRGSGPRGSQPGKWESFDRYLLNLASTRGATHVKRRVQRITREDGRPVIHCKDAPPQRYDLVIGAVGVNSNWMNLFQDLVPELHEPRTTKTFIAEIHFGAERVQQALGNSMHAFLLNIPRLEFAALIPKGEYVTVCMLGHDLDRDTVNRIMTAPAVQRCLPVAWDPALPACQCLPRINVGADRRIFSDRIVLIGDCGVSRLYKDGIGAAYRAAKACAVAVVCHGVSKRQLEAHYWPACRRMVVDNLIGKFMFACGGVAKRFGVLNRTMLTMVRTEQATSGKDQAMGMVLWDMFTGSAPYRNILCRALKPGFMWAYMAAFCRSVFGRDGAAGKDA